MVDDGGEGGAAQGSDVGDGEGAAGHVLPVDLAVADPLGRLLQLLAQLDNVLAVHVPDHGDDEAPFGVHGHADVVVALEDDLPGRHVEAGVEAGLGLEGGHRRLHGEDGNGQGAPLVLDLLPVLLPERLQVGDVGLVLMGDVGDLPPGPGHLSGRGLADGAKRHPLHRTPLGEIGQLRRLGRGGGLLRLPLLFGRGLLLRRFRRLLLLRLLSFGKGPDILGGHPAFGTGGGDLVEVDAQLPGQAAGGRGGGDGALPLGFGLSFCGLFRRPRLLFFFFGGGLLLRFRFLLAGGFFFLFRLPLLLGRRLLLLRLIRVEDHEDVAHLHGVPGLHPDLLDRAVDGGGDFGGRLVGLDGQNRLVLLHGVPFGDQHLHDLGLVDPFSGIG